jgi:hypothetical protein
MISDVNQAVVTSLVTTWQLYWSRYWFTAMTTTTATQPATNQLMQFTNTCQTFDFSSSKNEDDPSCAIWLKPAKFWVGQRLKFKVKGGSIFE